MNVLYMPHGGMRETSGFVDPAGILVVRLEDRDAWLS